MLQSKAPRPQAEQARIMRPGGLWQKQGLTPKAAKEETGQQISKLGAGVFTGEQQGLRRRPGAWCLGRGDWELVWSAS